VTQYEQKTFTVPGPAVTQKEWDRIFKNKKRKGTADPVKEQASDDK
jgi:hypothetical protein